MDSIIEEISHNPEKNYIISIHACYYHLFTQEYISFVNLNKIKQLGPDILIHLIDDVEDIHLRLKEPGRIYSEELGGALNKDIENLFELLKILDWRANETLLSRFYAAQLECKYFLLAVKHPCQTFYKLIFESDKAIKIYLSHPISKIRSLLYRKDFHEAEVQTKPITHITDYLSDKCICFFPTTIDEYRFELESSGIIYSQRWEQSKYSKNDESLLHIPAKKKNYIPYYEDYFEKLNTDQSPTDDETMKAIRFQHLLNHYLKEVSSQIGIRDKMLVEQSDAIFVSRPYLNGLISNGVKMEIDYIKKLYPTRTGPYGIIYFPIEDHYDAQVYQVKQGLIVFLQNSQTFRLEAVKEDECKEYIVKNFSDKIIKSFNDETKLTLVLQEIVKDLLGDSIIEKNKSYKEKALDSQLSSLIEAKYRDFAKRLMSSYASLVEELESNFIVFEDEYETQNAIDSFLTRYWKG